MLTILLNVLQAQTAKKEEKKDNEPATWKKKHITDYTEADLERLYDQWEVAGYLLSWFGGGGGSDM